MRKSISELLFDLFDKWLPLSLLFIATDQLIPMCISAQNTSENAL